MPAPSPRPATAVATVPINHSVCKWCYPKIALDEFARSAKDIGLQSVELLDPKDKGFVAQEFIPVREPLASPGEAVKLCTV